LVRSYRNGPRATLCAFNCIELDGEDLRWQPIEDRKSRLQKLIDNQHTGIAFNKHFDVEGAVVFHHACKLRCQGIVSKRLGSPYRSGCVDHWVRIKNPGAPAVRREAEEDWSGKRMTRGGTKPPRDTDRGLVIGDDVAPLPASKSTAPGT
jgi:ATP-dependent DNA ligase